MPSVRVIAAECGRHLGSGARRTGLALERVFSPASAISNGDVQIFFVADDITGAVNHPRIAMNLGLAGVPFFTGWSLPSRAPVFDRSGLPPWRKPGRQCGDSARTRKS